MKVEGMVGFILGIIIQSAILFVYLKAFSPSKELFTLVGENNLRTMNQQIQLDKNTQHLENMSRIIQGTLLPRLEK